MNSSVERPPTVAIIGNARVPEGDPRLDHAFETGKVLVDAGYRVVTGAMGGVMEAAGKGAHASSQWKPGTVTGIVPGHDPSSANEWCDIVVPTGLNHVRNTIVAASDAVVAIGGGAGTLSEIAFAWIFKRMVIAFRVEGWSGQLADKPVDHRTRYKEFPEDRVFGVDRAEDVVELLAAHLDKYHRRHSGIPTRR